MNNKLTKPPHPGIAILRQLLGQTKPQINYDEYIRSPEWKRRADKAKQRASYRCQVCYSPDNLDAHHRTYKRLGNEHDTDITVLCRECHRLYHDAGKIATRPIAAELE